MESILIAGLIICYGLVVALFLIGAIFQRERSIKSGYYFFWFVFCLHTVAVAFRWIVGGHFPVKGNYENILLGCWFIACVYFAIVFWKARFIPVGVAISIFNLISLGFGFIQFEEPTPLSAPYKSVWLFIHVLFAWLAYAPLTAAAGTGFMYLLREVQEKKKRLSPFVQKFPSLSSLDDLTYRLVLFGFLALGVMIVSGSIWAHNLWGSYWSWDPVETWSLLTWFIYAIYLHLKLTLGWKGKKLAWIAVLALLGVLMSFWGVQIVPSSFHLFRNF